MYIFISNIDFIILKIKFIKLYWTNFCFIYLHVHILYAMTQVNYVFFFTCFLSWFYIIFVFLVYIFLDWNYTVLLFVIGCWLEWAIQNLIWYTDNKAIYKSIKLWLIWYIGPNGVKIIKKVNWTLDATVSNKTLTIVGPMQFSSF